MDARPMESAILSGEVPADPALLPGDLEMLSLGAIATIRGAFTDKYDTSVDALLEEPVLALPGLDGMRIRLEEQLANCQPLARAGGLAPRLIL